MKTIFSCILIILLFNFCDWERIGKPELPIDEINEATKFPIDTFFEDRINPVVFSVNEKIYVGLGESSTGAFLQDFWEIDINSELMSPLDSFPGGPRSEATGFVIDHKIYVGTGTDGEHKFRDFYEFNTLDSTWTAIASLPEGGARRQASGFSANGFGYVLAGRGLEDSEGTFRRDVFEYDPSINSWSMKEPFKGNRRSGAKGFLIGNDYYFGLGYSLNTESEIVYHNDFYKFTPSLQTGSGEQWDSDSIIFPHAGRRNFIAFSKDQKGYIGLGECNTPNPESVLQDLWEFTPENSMWNEKDNFRKLAWTDAVVINQKIYIVGGSDSRNFLNPLREICEILIR